jgi:hypothetical protein
MQLRMRDAVCVCARLVVLYPVSGIYTLYEMVLRGIRPFRHAHGAGIYLYKVYALCAETL